MCPLAFRKRLAIEKRKEIYCMSTSIYEVRRKQLAAVLKAQGMDIAIFTPSTDYRYLTGSSRQASQRVTALIITPERSALLLPVFEAENETGLQRELEFITYTDQEDPISLLSDLLPASGFVAIGREMRAGLLLTLQNRFSKLLWCDADSLLVPIRRVKDVLEIETIETAQHMAEQALARLITEPLIGKTERQIASRLMELRLEEGFDAVSAGIVASGPNTALPHHVNGDRILKKGDILMFDIGGTYKGYRADFTRTFAVGKIPEGFSEIYYIVLKAYLAGKAAAKAGIPACQVDTAARQVIEEAGYGSFFPHRLGHGIGLDVHEEPFISSANSIPLKEGNVFSCEPGIYLPGHFGVRIEDLLVLEKHGARSLNTLSKELLVI